MKEKKILNILILLGVITQLFVLIPFSGTKADETVYNVDISTDPASGFLVASNMAPGDKKTSILNVTNSGDLDFNYSVSSRQETGDKDLYDNILLTISENQGKLYEGTLSGLSQFPLGTIIKTESKSLTFTAELPINIGNDTQGKSTTVAFDFTAIGHEEQIPTDGCFEPPFSNRNFTLHQKSTVPIKFHLRDPMGNLDTIARQNVRLEVTGPAVNGGNVNYVFRVNNGTLMFQNKVDEPHYHARFSTWDYPVVTDGNYVAKVYVGDKVSCQREFTVLKQGNRSNAP